MPEPSALTRPVVPTKAFVSLAELPAATAAPAETSVDGRDRDRGQVEHSRVLGAEEDVRRGHDPVDERERDDPRRARRREDRLLAAVHRGDDGRRVDAVDRRGRRDADERRAEIGGAGEREDVLLRDRLDQHVALGGDRRALGDERARLLAEEADVDRRADADEVGRREGAGEAVHVGLVPREQRDVLRR